MMKEMWLFKLVIRGYHSHICLLGLFGVQCLPGISAHSAEKLSEIEKDVTTPG